MRNALRSGPFKLKVDGSNYMLVTHEKISKSSKGNCTGSGLYLFSISEITIVLFYFTTTVGKLVSDIQWRQSRLKTTSAKWDFEALRLEN